MRSLFSILFIGLIILNICGYYGLFKGLEYQHANNFTSRLDHGSYNEDETITLKVPLTIPYHIDDEEYIRVNGQIEHNGQFFRLVKQKLAKDTLYIICIPDHQHAKLQKALTDYVKTFADQPVQNSQGKNVVSFIKDYLPAQFFISSTMHGWSTSIHFGERQINWQSWVPQITSPPPKA